nr:alanine racemase [Arenicellales bacterium]
ANAYGHNAEHVASAIENHADGFAVAGIEEAAGLVKAGIKKEIHLLSGFHESADLQAVSEWGLIPAIHTWEQVDQLEETTLNRPISVWVKFDSGMHRLGFDPSEVNRVVERLERLPHVAELRLMSHLGCADDQNSRSTKHQIEVFDRVCASHLFTKSLANSAGICAWPDTRLDWVRPGIMLYGCTPLLDVSERDLNLQPVMSLCSKLIAIKNLKRGDAIGYGGDYKCPQDMSVGVVACGYGDGYPRSVSQDAVVWLSGQRTKLVGRVSMDLISIDLTDVPDAEVGDTVELWGEHVLATDVALSANTISYEILSGVAPRVPRVMEGVVG